MRKQLIGYAGVGILTAGVLASTSANAAEKKAMKETKQSGPALSQLDLGPLSLSGLVDTRLIITDDAGPAPLPAAATGGASGTKTRYIGNGTDSKVLFRVSQLSLNADLKVAEQWTLSSQFNFDLEPTNANQNPSSTLDAVSLFYGYVKGTGVLGENGNLTLGVQAVPVLNENTGRSGSTEYTLTPGAIGTFILANLTVEGIDATWEGKGEDVNGSLSIGVFNNLDTLGTAPAAIGATTNMWGFSDVQPDARGTGDIDGDVGFYISGTLGDDEGKIMGNVAYMANGGDEGTAANLALGVQDTNFWTLGLKAHPGEGWTLMAQYLDGDSDRCTAAGAGCTGAAAINADFKSWYVLGSYKWDQGTRLTLRYDDFNNDVSDGSAATLTDAGDEEDGHSWTIAIKHDLGDNQQIGFEYINVDADNTFSNPVLRVVDSEDDQFQLSYQLSF